MSVRWIKAISRGFTPVLLIACMFTNMPQTRAQQPSTFAFKDPSLPIDKRVDDLVSRMTLEEKISQMMNGAAAIERLGIPDYDWWSEGLHGVARAGYATVFPQAIGLAATWNTDLMFRVADVISTEARAKNNEFLRKGERGRYKGLTFWSPNINIFRDPRWGRGQETYGEDPYLTSRMGVAFVKGLQGNDPRYLKVVATPKHYAVHSGPEPDRHGFDAKATEKDLQETYLPAFRATIVEGGAQSVMCAYNRTNSEPACANKELFDDLRNKWGFSGYVVSDCGAINDIYQHHHFTKTEGEASAVSVKAGTDLTCGREYRSLVQAVKDGLISETEINTAVKRLMKARFQLGMFDPPAMVPYAQIPFSQNDSEPHRQLSLQAARESIVLLKNQSNTLPLKKDLKTIAVIGPSADNLGVLLGNYNGQPSKYVTPLVGIKSKVSSSTRVLYATGVLPPAVVTQPIEAKAFNGGLRGEYFNNRDLKGDPALVRMDAKLDFDWGAMSPGEKVNEDNFSVRWSGKLVAPATGKYQIGISANGGVRVVVDNQLVIEELTNRRTRSIHKEISLEQGHSYDIRVEYFENANPYASIKLSWSSPNTAAELAQDALAKAKEANAVVMMMGITPSVEGEEMDVQVEGFRGGDRTDITLPKEQVELLRQVESTGKPVVLVLLGGSAIAVNADDHVGALLDAWYPGEEGGTAIADVLFGDYNPAGRLPVTFYKSVGDLPAFTDYSMQGRTYRYFKGTPLYPFGFGLSYTSFKYDKLKFAQTKIAAGAAAEVTVELQNTGAVAGDEVVELYLSQQPGAPSAPIRSLAGLKRVALKPGERQKVTFKILPEQMATISDDGKRLVKPGELLVTVGGKQPGFSGSADANTTTVVSGTLIITGQQKELP